jgi:DNA-binding GntR family transcriptional regulator
MLRDLIISQELAPGSRLILEDLSHQLGLSMTPIREALPVLEAEGFISQSPHKGATVSSMDSEEVLELYATRSGMEAMVAKQAVERLTDADIANMQQQLQQMHAQSADPAAFLLADKEFHLVLYQAADSQRWLETIETLWRRCSRYMLASTAMIGAIPAIQEDHHALLKACLDRDADRVASLTVAHLEHSRNRLLNDWPSRTSSRRGSG